MVLIEAVEPTLDWPIDSHDLRVSAITRASQHLLQNLGVWQSLVGDRVTAYQHMRVWDRAGFSEIHFDAAEVAEPDLGHIIENRVIVRALWRALEAALGRLCGRQRRSGISTPPRSVCTSRWRMAVRARGTAGRRGRGEVAGARDGRNYIAQRAPRSTRRGRDGARRTW